jgi:hypothetical protein
LDTTPTTRHNFKEWKLSDPIRPVAKWLCYPIPKNK